jgi:Flp pilus assembly pilin Flp
MKEWLRRLCADDQGQDLVEYALLIVCFTLATFSIVSAGFSPINVIWGGVNSHLANAQAAAGGS